MWHEPLSIDPALLREVGFWQEAYRQDCGHLLSVWALAQGYEVYDQEAVRLRVYIGLQRQVRQNRFLTELVLLFREHGIPAVLLKGYGLCSLYPDPTMRDYGDIDLYVGCEHYQEAYSLIARTYSGAYWLSPMGVGHHFILVMDEQRELVAEIHNLSMDFFGQPKVERMFFDYTELSFACADTLTLYDTVVSVPSLSYNALYLFVHLWHHFLASGVGMRQLCDWVLCLRALSRHLSPVEWHRFEQQLRQLLQSMHLLSVWQSFGYVAVKYLGLPPNAFPLYSVSLYSHSTHPSKTVHPSKIVLPPKTIHPSRKFTYRIWQSERLYRQLLADGHCGRSTALRSEQIMHSFHSISRTTPEGTPNQPLSKPRQSPCLSHRRSTLFPNLSHRHSNLFPNLSHRLSRLSRRLHSFYRLTYNALQLSKLFPLYSFRLYCAQLFAALYHKK